MRHYRFPARAGGMSLIEVMVAIALSALILLGITQIFGANKASHQLQNALSRIQENARFALIALERDVRMAGYLGGGNDLNRTAAGNGNFTNHLAANGIDTDAFPYRFHRALEVFNANALVTAANPPVGGANDWTPALPAALGNARPLQGSDILVLRFFSEESIPLTGFNPADDTFTVLKDSFPDGKPFTASGIYGVGNYRFADVFQATHVEGHRIAAGYTAGEPGNRYQYDPQNSPGRTWRGDREVEYGVQGTGQRWWNAELHRANYVAYYVGQGAGGQPALMMQTLTSTGSVESRELLEGVESIQVLIGRDTAVPPDDTADTYVTAAALIEGSSGEAQRDERWRQARSLQLALLIRSVDTFNSPQPTDRQYVLLDQSLTRPDDRRLRQIYRTTVSLRNRISNAQ
ncbi:PilW family protein [Tahibacter amnicola]|uniref:PilW family protein n=1 Tax=Tahibacter amnicola TaxID=2976241 RepID=A0ABY6B8H7_9GAMM|nr:PilW family protein [Tahibacter amnicola]UXI66319.1 PilW family protein [Tahibacter amnicola]